MRFGLFSRKVLVLDLGSAHTVLATHPPPALLRVPTQVALVQPARSRGGAESPRVLAVGEAAAEAEAPPGGVVRLVRPLERGRVRDPFAMGQLLSALLARLPRGPLPGIGPARAVGLLVPAQLDPNHGARLQALLADVGLSRVRFIEAPFAAARACGLELERPRGHMIMNLGAGTTQLAVFSMGGLVAWELLEFGGLDLDQAILNYVEVRYSAALRPADATRLKHDLGSVYPKARPEGLDVPATSVRTRRETRMHLDDNEIREVLVDACEPLVMAISRTFERVPPELAADVARDGILMVGGGALLAGLPALLGERLGLAFLVADHPADVTARGALELMLEG